MAVTFGAVFPRVMRPVFGPGLAAAAGGVNWWEAGGATGAVAVYQPKGAASLAASYVNLANPGTYDATPGVAPTWDATGWTFAAGNYLVSGADSANKPVSILMRITVTSLAAVRAMLGASINRGIEFRANTDGALSLLWQNVAVIGSSAAGSVAINTNVVAAATYGSAGAWAFYTNGNSIASGTNNKTFTDGVFWVGRAANTEQFIGSIQAVAIYNNTLTAPQVAAISTAMAAL